MRDGWSSGLETMVKWGTTLSESIDACRQLVDCLRGGGLAIIPGITNYSLVVNASLDEAVERFYRLKQRAPSKPITLLVPPHDAERHITLPARNRRGLVLLGDPIVLLGRTAPGLRVTPRVSAGSWRTGILFLDTPLHKLLYSTAEFPIAGSSLNRSGEPMITRFEDVRTRFADQVDLVVDGADCPHAGEGATVLDLSEEPPTLVRPGFVTETEIRAVLPELRVLEVGAGPRP
jgi:L-threonylcarbamoyladenylate synthase